MAQNIVIIIFLCVVLLLTGIALPKYLSNQYLKLRTALNSPGSSLKFISKENSTLINAEGEDSNNASQSIANDYINETEKFQISISPSTVSSLSQVKVKKRSKRTASEANNESFAWNFNLNVTRHENVMPEETTKNDSQSSVENKQLGVKLLMKGNGPGLSTFNELQNALKSVGEFLKNVFGGNIKKGANELSEINGGQIKQSFKGSSLTKSEVEITQNSNTVKLDYVDIGNESLTQTGREGKFLFRIFGFGEKPLNKTTTPLEVEATNSTEAVIGTDRSTGRNENSLDNVLLKSDVVTENSQKALDIHSESLFKTEQPATDLIEDDVEEFKFRLTTLDDCSECVTEDFESSVSPHITDEIFKVVLDSTINSTEPEFTDEILENFCMSLVNKLEESQENDIDSEQNPTKSAQNQIFDLVSPLITGEITSNTAIIDDSLLVRHDESTTKIRELSDRQSRFFNFNMFGLGSGRSIIDEETEDISFDGQEANDIEESENLPSVLDCENYFRKKQTMKMFPKPNLMDMISDPKIKLTDFSNATISAQLKEQQLQFLTGLLTNMNNSVETSSKNSLNKENDSGEESKISLPNKSNVMITKDLFITESSDFSSNDKWKTSGNINTLSEVQQTTEEQRKGRIFNIFGFGSGSDDQGEINTPESRLFLDSLFGSAQTLPETSDGTNKSDGNKQFEKEDSFSGDERILDTSNGNPFEDISTTSVQERRFLNSFGFAGSGNGRELTEVTELAQNELDYVQNECEDDCDHEVSNATDESYECDDNECDFKDPLVNEDANNTKFSSDNISSNKCEDDCYHEVGNATEESHECDDNECDFENPLDHEDLQFTSNISSNECEDDCYYEFSNATEESHECDDNECNFENTLDHEDAYYAKFSRTNISSNGNECEDDCYQEVHNATEVSHECDDNECDFENPLDHKDEQFTRNISSNKCEDDCYPELNNATEESRECDNNECDFKNPLDPVDANNEEFTRDNISSNENVCDNDCLDIQMLNKETVENDLTGEFTTDDRKHLTVEYLPESFENCDECSENTIPITEEPYMSTGSYESTLLISKDSTLAKLNEENDCNDCNDENDLLYEKQITEKVDLLGTLKSNISINVTVTDLEYKNNTVIAFHVDTGIETAIENGSGNAIRQIESKDVTENLFDAQETTEIKSRRFFETIFLTGSGDGGLFEDDGGPINLVEEEKPAIASMASPRRRGRLDDEAIYPCDDCEIDLSEYWENYLKGKGSDNSSTHHFNSNVSLVDESKGDSKITPETSKDGETSLRANITKLEDGTSPSAVFSNSISPFTGVSIISTEPQPRFCMSASECNSTLNERCITSSYSTICDCGRSFVRHRETGKCVGKRHIEASLKFPAEMFDSNLQNPESTKYKNMKEKSTKMMLLLLSETPHLLPIVTEIQVTAFSSGSLIVRWNLVLAVENESEAKLVHDMEYELKRALKNAELINKTPLNVKNASVLSIYSATNPCNSTELNYCSRNAHCLWDEAYPGRFLCHCKEHYLDVSSNQFYPGETCIAKCTPSYCGSNGHCEILENDKRHCLCSGLYFGERCEVPGLAVLGVLSAGALISFIVLALVVFRKRCRTRRYGRTPTFRRSEEIGTHAIANGRLSDAIALERNMGAEVAKFSHINTPEQGPPIIRVTRPTPNDSSISIDYDTSFDMTPTSVQEQSTGNGNATL